MTHLIHDSYAPVVYETVAGGDNTENPAGVMMGDALRCFSKVDFLQTNKRKRQTAIIVECLCCDRVTLPWTIIDSSLHSHSSEAVFGGVHTVQVYRIKRTGSLHVQRFGECCRASHTTSEC